MVLRCCIVVLRRVAVLRCILLLFLPFPVLLFLFSFPHLVLVPRYGEITMKAVRDVYKRQPYTVAHLGDTLFIANIGKAGSSLLLFSIKKGERLGTCLLYTSRCV